MKIRKVLVALLSIICMHVYAAENGKTAVPRYQDLLDTLFDEITSVYDDKKPASSVTMTCSYFEYDQPASEIVHIERTKSRFHAERAASKTFKKGTRYERQDFEVKVGESAECVFPSGSRVRVKIGKKEQDLSDRCLSEDKFVSVWVNKRKVISRALFSSQCDYEDPVLDTKIQIYGAGLEKIKQCTVERGVSTDASAKEKNGKAKKPVSICMDYPNVSRYPVDSVEYPPRGVQKYTVGKIVLLVNRHEVCSPLQQELQAHTGANAALALAAFSKNSPLSLYAEKSEPVQLPEELAKKLGQGWKSYQFDFNNDEKLDQIVEQRFARKAMAGNALFVSSGNASDRLVLSGAVSDEKKSRVFPCQINKEQQSFQECSPFSQKGDDVSIRTPWKIGGEALSFHTKHAELTPFAFKNVNFVAMTGTSGATRHVLAVFRPMPDWTFKPVCLYQKTTENY